MPVGVQWSSMQLNNATVTHLAFLVLTQPLRPDQEISKQIKTKMLNKIYIGFVLFHESTEEITAAPTEETTAAPLGKSSTT